VAQSRPSSAIPCLRYEKAQEAISFLCDAFGFEKRAVYEGENGAIVHAELAHDGGMIMLSSSGTGEWDRFFKTPAAAGAATGSIYVVVADADSHYARVRAAGAKILRPIQDESYGGRGYGCADPEGHVWYFGTYDPWSAGVSPAA
jgi:uncharacterized glyoxalase superfamily protein PhnB